MAEIKNLKKAAKRIAKAVKNKERIIIFGDADLDGVSATIILKESIQNLGGGNLIIYFPDREKEGYGINEKALGNLKQYAPAFFISLDCGIGNFKEVKLAKKIGLEVAIIDHHEVLDGLPEASIIVDPKQKGDKYPFKQFATVGLVFRLAEELLGEKLAENIRKNFLELVALATIADMMPKTEDNAVMIAEGLNYVKSSWRPGLQALFDLASFKNLEFMEQVYKINSLLNIRDVEEGMPAAYRLLTSSDVVEAKSLAEKLLEKNIEKKEIINEMLEGLDKKVSFSQRSPIIFEGDAGWEVVLLGIVASLAVKKYQKPAFLYKKGEKESQGGIRAPSGFNVVEAMKTCSKLLETYGGHPQAAGFRVKNENLEEFKNRLIDYYTKK